MKNLKKKLFKNRFSKLVKNERGQGMLEYILLVVVVVGLVVILKPYFSGKVEEIKGQLDGKIGNILSE